MKEILTNFYKQHKKYTLSDKFWNKITSIKQLLTVMSLTSIITAILLKIIFSNPIPIDNPLLSFGCNTLFFFICSFFLLIIPVVISSAFSCENDNKFYKFMTQILINSQKDEKLNSILAKLNVIYFYQLSDDELLDEETYKNAIEQFKNGTFSQDTFNLASQLTCNQYDLNSYYEKNKNLIEMPYDELLLMTKKRIANLMIKKEKENQDKLDFMHDYADSLDKEEVILKLSKKIKLSL
jgi:hypothetical protein